jgi:hypothetical protein
MFKPKFPMSASPLPLPPPPAKVDNVHVASGPTDKSKVDNTSPALADNKVASLRAYQRARGLCQYCAEKWPRGHKYASTMQLHAMQEI